MSSSSLEKVAMKSSKTGHLTDSKEKMKHASILIEDKKEAANKRYDDDYLFIRYGKTYAEIKRMEHETLVRWMRGMTFGRAHFYCTTLILLFTFLGTFVFTIYLFIPFIVIIVLLTLAHRSTANHFDKKKEEEQDKEGREEKEELLKACLLACC